MAGSVDKMLLAARGHAKRGEYRQAEALYRDVLGRFPGNRRAKAGLEALAQVSKAKPAAGPPRALLQQLMGLMQTGRNRELVQQTKRALTEYPEAILLLELKAAGEGAWAITTLQPRPIAAWSPCGPITPTPTATWAMN
ncbi:hypothetical protein BMG03_08375 [Thioclava nitratireducens]|uniref:Tetratricopeptide repeat protein n=1 Tax=Thioclava nitratireducens TaxID=1915078 RepID=A0ABM6IGB4_9RHOB|nr:hypothetical protein [Thioclava nitratireducens]AQS47819.1 hypothetical protein BMG03_08375 [Thioclava nitratireducens]